MLNLDKIQENIRKRQEEHDRIWNAAIEAAAKKIEGAPLFANEIRKLKRPIVGIKD